MLVKSNNQRQSCYDFNNIVEFGGFGAVRHLKFVWKCIFN